MAMSEAAAAGILRVAIKEGRAGEMLGCLFEGGSVTVDAETRKLVLFPRQALADFAEDEVGAGHRILSLDEAATHTEDERGPWQWSQPVHAIISDSWKWKDVREPWAFFVAESAIENLYRYGFVVAEVICDDCEHPAREHTLPSGCRADGCGCSLRLDELADSPKREGDDAHS